MTNKETLGTYRDVMNEIKSFHPTSGSFEAGDDNTIIQGDALGEGTWNRFYYPADELKRATESLIGVPLVIGHGKTDDDEVGKVTNAEWNPNKEVIEFEAEVSEDKVSQMIKRSVVDSVSVGVEFEEVKNNGKRIATDLDFYELALVKEPAFVDGIKKIIDEEMPEEEKDKINEMSKGGEYEMAKDIDERELAEFIASLYDERVGDILDLLGEIEGDPKYDERELAGMLADVYNVRTGLVLDALAKLTGEDVLSKENMFDDMNSDDKIVIDIPKEIYDELSDKENVDIVGRYPGPKGYFPPSGVSKYPYPAPRPRGTFNSILEIFNRLDQLADEIGLEFETKYPYPSPEENSELSSEDREEILQVEVDVETARGILDDLENYVEMLVDEIGYPGPETEIADTLEEINEKMEALANELGMDLR